MFDAGFKANVFHWGKSHDLLTGTIQISIQRALKDLKKSHYIVKGHGVSGKF